VAAATALAARGARVRLHDRDAALVPDVPAEVEVALGERDPDALLEGVEVLVKSPGVPGEVAVVARARARGVPVWSEVELGYRLLAPGVRLVGVTGTNGKTTTAELAGAMLAAAGQDVVVAGNVGRALTGVAADLAPGAVVVVELSSFQLEDVHRLRCDAACLLNVTPDHLDRHGTLAAYAAAKLRIFERQTPADVAVLDLDDPYVAALDALPGAGRRVGVHGDEADAIGFARSSLRGDHNRENAACAAALARALGAPEAALETALVGFAPVPHRLERIGAIRGVELWNDSKATNVDATLKALTAFPDGRLRIILGGSDKGADFAPLVAALPRRVRAAYLTGPAGERLAPLLAAAGVHVVAAGRVEAALDAALADAEAGEAILLAPACASFDEFRSYEHRGDAFRALARVRGAR
jgi:UDP-N-acetylmuramoylalanine--D-glutamate ligase